MQLAHTTMPKNGQISLFETFLHIVPLGRLASSFCLSQNRWFTIFKEFTLSSLGTRRIRHSKFNRHRQFTLQFVQILFLIPQVSHTTSPILRSVWHSPFADKLSPHSQPPLCPLLLSGYLQRSWVTFQLASMTHRVYLPNPMMCSPRNHPATTTSAKFSTKQWNCTIGPFCDFNSIRWFGHQSHN